MSFFLSFSDINFKAIVCGHELNGDDGQRDTHTLLILVLFDIFAGTLSLADR